MRKEGLMEPVRETRIQGAIVRQDQLLLIQHRHHPTGRSYWLLPGGGLDGDETEEECVVREMKEETGLEVRVERPLLEEPAPPDGGYRWRKTYLCRPVSGVAKPGYEPEPEAAAEYSITAVQWLDLRDDSGWEEAIKEDPFTYPQLERLRGLLGYGGG
jgi:8-oxo-dGTP pyrophosphatase MutT (NUDIX family)